MNNVIHPDFDVILSSKGGMFDVGANSLEKNVGRFVEFENPTCLAEEGIHEIVCVQKNYDGDLVYRVKGIVRHPVFNGREDTMGRCAAEEEITFIDYKN